jgi:hypothetical protein
LIIEHNNNNANNNNNKNIYQQNYSASPKHVFPSDARSSQLGSQNTNNTEQTQQLIAKINSLAKQLRSEQIRAESLEK